MNYPKLRFKKSQSALEFLTTYGWAFLVILIMISALAYFGILNPSRVLPNRCTFGSEIQCLDHQISATANTFRLRLKSSVGEPITVQSITLSSESVTSYTCTGAPAMPSGWKTGEIQDLSWTTCNSALAGISSGQKGKVIVAIRYYPVASGSNYAKDVLGDVYSTII